MLLPFRSASRVFALFLAATLFCLAPASAQENALAAPGKILTGAAALSTDWTADAPGVRRRITVDDLPPPYASKSVRNFPRKVRRPDNAKPRVPAGFRVEEYAHGFRNPRYLLTAPNGDIFVTESGPGEIRVLRDTDGDGKPDLNQVFADKDLTKPFGIAFYPPGPNPQYLYAANTDGVVRFPYRNGDLQARGPAEKLGISISSGGLLTGGGHWTRDLKFSPDGKRMFISVGSKSNVDTSNSRVEQQRARIFVCNPDGSDQQVYASGVRNAVGIAFRPGTDDLWMSVNERDGLGDDLVPDYISRVQPGGFYGWPWFYLGRNLDPRTPDAPTQLVGKVLLPDVLVQSHSATLNLCFYEGKQFPAEYRGDIFAAFHGSWNRSRRTGYKVVRVPIDKATGQAKGYYEDFLTGFVTPEGDVWGRPVGLTVAKDGSLLMSEDAGNTIWRISHEGRK